MRLVTNHKVSQVGIAEFLTAPDEAVITFRGKGYTSPEPVIEMAALRCADATLAHGYHYFVITSATDMSRHSLFSTPGYAQPRPELFWKAGEWNTMSSGPTVR